jgi:hypothetical protein
MPDVAASRLPSGEAGAGGTVVTVGAGTGVESLVTAIHAVTIAGVRMTRDRAENSPD